jgi:predicted phosphodiesterase
MLREEAAAGWTGAINRACQRLGISADALRKGLASLDLPSPSEIVHGPRRAAPSSRSEKFECASSPPPPEYPPPQTVDPAVPESPRHVSGLRTILVIGDAHIPYHDKRAWAVVLEVARELRPDILVHIGDGLDCYSISRFRKDPDRVRFLRDELEEGRTCMRELEQAAKARQLVYCEGNHETRLPRLIADKVPALHRLVSVPEYLGLREHGWEWVPYKQSKRIGKMSFTHDVGRWGTYASRWTLHDAGTNIAFGHTHALRTWFEGTTHEGPKVALNTGWLGDVEAVDYKHRDKARREYQHGFGVVYQQPDGLIYPHAVPIIRGQCEVAGRLVSA